MPPAAPPPRSFVDTHQLFATAEVVPLVHALLEVVYATSHDLEVQVRACGLPSRRAALRRAAAW